MPHMSEYVTENVPQIPDSVEEVDLNLNFNFQTS